MTRGTQEDFQRHVMTAAKAYQQELRKEFRLPIPVIVPGQIFVAVQETPQPAFTGLDDLPTYGEITKILFQKQTVAIFGEQIVIWVRER